MAGIEDGSLGTRRARQLRRVGHAIAANLPTSEELLEYARDTLAHWLKGYTEPLGDGMQRRVIVEEVEDDYIIFTTRLTGFHDTERRCKIKFSIEELQ